MERGFLKLYRKLADNPLWKKKPFSDGQAWVDLLLVANHSDGVIDKRGNRININRGQVGYSVLGLSDRWGWSRGKVDRFLKYLENEQQIEQQKSSVTTLITLINYEQYNEVNTKTDSRRTADGQQTDTNKNEKNEKKVKYGEFKNVLLLEAQFSTMSEKFGVSKTEDYIERLSLYLESTGKKYKSHYATILAWSRKDKPTAAKQSEDEISPEELKSRLDHQAFMDEQRANL